MTKFEGHRERVALAIYDTICNSSRGSYVVPQSGRLFVPYDPTAKKPVDSNTPLMGCLPSDNTAIFERLVLEVRAPTKEALGVLRHGVVLQLVLGEKLYPVLPPYLDKIDDDGTARYDYFLEPCAEDPAIKAMSKKEKKVMEERWGKIWCGPPQVPARMGFRVEYFLTSDAHKILLDPNTFARVWILGGLTRDVQ